MTKIQRSVLTRYPAPLMFDLVDDIESYPNFLPWCRSSKILVREEGLVEATLDIAKSGFNKSFTTRNTHRGKDKMYMNLVDGPFDSMVGVWTFTPLRDDASKVALDLEFELRNRLKNLAFGAVFSQICNAMVVAFSQRAKDLYDE